MPGTRFLAIPGGESTTGGAKASRRKALSAAWTSTPVMKTGSPPLDNARATSQASNDRRKSPIYPDRAGEN